MPTKPGWTDIDFIGAYNAANSTDWKTSLAWFLWVPSAGKYWIAVDMFAGDGVTESPGSWAIIDPITRSIEGFSDESGFTHTTIDEIAYSESDGCVWTRGRNSLFVGFYYTKYASDGSVLVQSPSVQGSLTHITASPVTGQLYGWQNNSPSPGYQIKTVDGTTGELGSAVITSSDPIAVTFVFDGAGDVWYRTNSGPTSAKVWRYDVAGATSYEALSVSGTTDLPYLWLYNSRDDTILLSYPSGSPKKIKWINVSDYSVAETVEFGSDWSNSIRSFDEFDTYRGKVWCWISAYYGLITIEAYALVDPADWDAEPEYYEWGAYGGGYAVTNGYQHEVCVDAAVYDPAEIHYTRIWPCWNTGGASPLWGSPPLGLQGGFMLHVSSTDRLWISAYSDYTSSMYPDAAPGLWAIVDPGDITAVESWSSDPFVSDPNSFAFYDAINDRVWMDTWTSVYSGWDNYRIVSFNGTTGAYELNAPMPTDCFLMSGNPVTGDVVAVVVSSSLRRYIYKLDQETGALGDLLFDVGEGKEIWGDFTFDGAGDIWITAVTAFDGFGNPTDFEIRKIASDGSSSLSVWSTSGGANGAYRLVHDSTRDKILAFRPNVDIAGSSGSYFLIDVATSSIGADVALPTAVGDYPITSWQSYPVYDPVRDLYWLSVSSDGSTSIIGVNSYDAWVAIKASDLSTLVAVPVAYYGSEENLSIYLDDPLNDVIDFDFHFDTTFVGTRAGRAYWCGYIYAWDDATSREVEFRFIQWWEPCPGVAGPPMIRRRVIININMRRR